MAEVLSAPTTPKVRRESKAERERLAWAENRKTYLGATEVAAILGLHPYMSAHHVWLSKLGLGEDTSNIAMRAGIHMEPFIASEFIRLPMCSTLGLRCQKSKTYRNDRFPFLACNPDREVLGFRHEGKRLRVGLECKRVGHWASRNFGQDGSDQVPEHYLIQVMWQLLIAKFDAVCLAALIDDRDVIPYWFTFDPELSQFAHVFPREDATSAFNFAVRWWRRHVDEQVEPPLSHVENDTRWVQRERASYDNGQLCCANEELTKDLVRLDDALRAEAAAVNAVAEIKNNSRLFMAREGASEMEFKHPTRGVLTCTYRTNAKGVPVFKHPYRGEKA